MPNHTISGTYPGPVTIGAAVIFVTVEPGSYLEAGLYAPSIATAWTITNYAKLVGPSTTHTAGLSLGSGGTVVNQLGASISGYDGITAASTAIVTVTNSGTIRGATTSSLSIGVYLPGGGAVTNLSTGTISGYNGIDLSKSGSAATVTNSGTITGLTSTGTGQSNADGVYLEDGGGVTNLAGGGISGNTGVLIILASGSVVNNGSIAGANASGYAGVRLDHGGSVTNTGTGLISGYVGVAAYLPGTLGGTGTVTNSGTIDGAASGAKAAGIFLKDGGTVTNQAGGTISAASGIIIKGAAGTVTDAGTIAGTGNAVSLASGFANRLIVDPGAVFTGTVSGGNSIGSAIISTLELASAASAGTLSGLGTKYIDFAATTIDSGAQWTLAGTNTVVAGSTVTDTGTLSDAGTVTIAGTLAGVGTNAALTLLSGAVVTNASGGTIAGYYGLLATTVASVTNFGGISGSSTALSHGSGVHLSHGGTVVNGTGGAISGNAGIVGAYAAITVTNSGTVTGLQSGTGASGIALDDGGVVTNQSGGTIVGRFGIRAGAIGAATVMNSGSIVGDTTGDPLGTGLWLDQGGATNQSGGLIEGYRGIYDGGSPIGATLTNSGTIDGAMTGSHAVGVFFHGDGNIANLAGGTIAGYRGIYQHYGALVTNAGVITGATSGAKAAGVYFDFGGTLINTGLITAASGVVMTGFAATVTNAGTIAGTGNAVSLSAGFSDRLIVDPGAVFTGTVTGGNSIGAASISTLELASSASAGTISGLGSKYIDFASTTIDSGARWTLAGTNTLATATSLTNFGVLTVAGSGLSDTGVLINDGTVLLGPTITTIGTIVGTGQITIAAGSTLDTQSTVASGQTIVFTSNNGTLDISPSAFYGEVLGFQSGDTIVLNGVNTANSPAISNNNTLVVSYAGSVGTIAIQLDPTKTYNASEFTVVDPTSGDDYIITNQICFLPGTLIRTIHGEVAVEGLAVGDFVRTFSGGKRPITWIGTGTVMVPRGAGSAARPVIVRAGAIADGVPNRDLHVTKGHSLYLDGVLIPVEFLVNHHSIVWNDDITEVTIYHVELDAHDILIANGAPAESYRDDGNRWLFHNANANWDAPEKPHFAPVLTGGPIVDAVWRRLLDRAGAPTPIETTDDPDLHLQADGERIDAIHRDGPHIVFALPHAPKSLRIRSRAASPSRLGLSRDPRELGVAIAALTRTAEHTPDQHITYDDPTLTDGFHDPEHDNDWRWTNGDAAVPNALFQGFDGPFVLELTVPSSSRYPRTVQAAA